MGIMRAVVVLMPSFYVPNEARITLNGYVLAFSAAVSVLTGVLFGLAPAISCSRLQLVETLKDAAKGSSSGAGGRHTRNLLVVVEIALSVILLVGAGLTIRGFINIQHTDLGFRPDRVLMVGVQLPPKRYTTWEQRIAFTQSLLERVAAIPGAQSAAIGNGGLPFGGPRSRYSIEGQPQSDAQPVIVGLISPDYSRTMGIPLLSGRGLSTQDVAHAEHVALINQAAARLWPNGVSPIGRRIHLTLLDQPQGALPAPGAHSGDVTVVGILANIRNAGLLDPPAPQVFVPYTLIAPPGRALAVRAHGDPMRLLNAVREHVLQLDKDLPVNRPITMEEVVGTQIQQPRFNMAIFMFFGAIGLALAAIGIFSVLSYNVVQRTHEIGVRMALGAERNHILRLTLATGGKLVLAGLAAGLAGSLLLGGYLQSQVFQVPVTDPISLAGVIVLLAGTAFLACFVPARRASRLEPMAALRHD